MRRLWVQTFAHLIYVAEHHESLDTHDVDIVN